ncbi:MAG TPA: glycosyltransferase family 4 protein [Geminicoccaceae bacterium]|nr:glycosyltransferase family 4 protein [Geminicoccaceae bacterium]
MTSRSIGTESPERRLRVLALAESAHPEAQSVSLIGWSHSRALTAFADVHLVTRSANRAAILAAGLCEGRDFTAIDLDAYERAIHRAGAWLRGDPDKGWTTLAALSLPAYYAFEQAAWRRFGAGIQAGEFDLVHRITPVSPALPSLIARRCARAGVPFVLGPINGGLPWPRHFNHLRHAEREWLSYLRGAHRLLPGYRATRRHAAAILAGSRTTLAQVPARWRHKCIYVPENGIDPARFPAPPPRPPRALPLRAVFVGRLVPAKGVDIGLEAAAALLHDGRLRLDIVGDGPERARLEAQVAGERLTTAVRLHGRVGPKEVHRHLAAADLLLFPSVRDFGGGVVLEAMAMGVVPLVIDSGGPGELVTPASGLKVPLGSRAEIVAGLRRVLAAMAAEPARLEPLAARARQRVATLFTWQQKARQVRAVYGWVLGEQDTKPDFGFTD